MFEKELAKANGEIATIRKDKVKKLLSEGLFERVVCDYHYTDDYAYDNATGFGKGEREREWAMEDLPHRMYKDSRCYVDPREPNRLHIIIHSNLSYSVYFSGAPKPEGTKRKETQSDKPAKQELPTNVVMFDPDGVATSRQLWALHCITKLDTRGWKITRRVASDLIGKAKAGDDISELISIIVETEKAAQ